MANSQSPSTKDALSALSQLETTLNEYLVVKAPFTLPGNIKEIIAKLAPWFTLIGVVIAIPAILLVLGLGALVAPFAMMGGPAYAANYGTMYVVSMLVSVVALVLQAIAIPGLFKRSKGAWNLLYYASLITLVSGIVGGNVIGALISAVIGLYFLFQVRELYK